MTVGRAAGHGRRTVGTSGCARAKVTVQAWARGTFIARLFSLFILPAEMGIASGGFRGALPRKMMRGHVNELLAQLGGPPIQ